MNNFLKQLTCKHKNKEFVKSLGGDSVRYSGGFRSIWKCNDCGKQIMGKYRDYEYIEVLNEKLSNLNGISKGKVSDGFHTFDELYNHRMILFSIVCNQNHIDAWKSKLHDDGTMFDDYFIVGLKTIEGQFTYHYHIDNWDLFEVGELDKAPEWDGHTADDITRLLELNEYNVRKPQFKTR